MYWFLYGLGALLVGALSFLAWGGWHGWRQRTDPLCYAVGLSVAVLGIAGLLVSSLAWWVVGAGLTLAFAGFRWRLEVMAIERTVAACAQGLSLEWLNGPLDAAPEWLRQHGQRCLVVGNTVAGLGLVVDGELTRLAALSGSLILLLLFACDRLDRDGSTGQLLAAFVLFAGVCLTAFGWQLGATLLLAPGLTLGIGAAWLLWWAPIPAKQQAELDAERAAAKKSAKQEASPR